MGVRCALIPFLVALPACSDRALTSLEDAGLPDLGVPHRDAAPPDRGHVPPPDAPPPAWAAGTCSAAVGWKYVQRQAVAAELVDLASAQAGESQVVRVAVQVDTSCELPGISLVQGYRVADGDGGTDPAVMAHNWVQDPPCAAQSGLMVRTFAIPAGTATEVVLRDGLTGVEILRFSGSPRPDSGYLCPGWIDSTGACVGFCEFDENCRSGQLCGTAWSDSLPPICVASTFDTCVTHADCPPGYACELGPEGFNECADHRLKRDIGAACTCDADCPPGLLCAHMMALGGCELPCLSDLDCEGSPGGPYCMMYVGAGMPGVSGVCGVTE